VQGESGGTPNHDAAVSYGYEFLEKFFQLPFRLPRTGPQNIEPFIASLVGTATPTAKMATETSTAETKQTLAKTPAPALQDVVTDNPLVREILSGVAPFLDFNPRRLKQFLNLFRLRHYVLESTGMLATGKPTLRQLGRIVALEIRWPRFVEDVLRRPTLLADLEKSVVEEPAPAKSERPDLSPWFGSETLVIFLRAAHAADRVGTLDLGAILGAPPRLVSPSIAVQVTPSVSMVVRSADGSIREVRP
jgi:hypothetical protein